jgi:hypothetical protein
MRSGLSHNPADVTGCARGLWAVFGLLVLGACQPAYNLECAGPGEGLSVQECQDVAARVVAVKPAAVGHQLGDLMSVSVELMDCSAREARREMLEELADPTADRCWTVGLSYAGAVLTRFAIRHAPSGEVTVH